MPDERLRVDSCQHASMRQVAPALLWAEKALRNLSRRRFLALAKLTRLSIAMGMAPTQQLAFVHAAECVGAILSDKTARHALTAVNIGPARG
ncbi:hypothetical protein ASD02_22500 [Ensifer sp. Root1252]|jgi:hypothetical protein|nr:hypothetical protein ASD02_22500 [Ensifer sp. Root1252]KQW82764.1 hypothetical protein ASD03_22680 [Ensifer sp. Root127]KRC59927.1 hypothetical protein ASE32_12760 [Ensifer sp. Root231]KRD01289.1 hypothetical protein ASE47_23100 [Ensifer sp. Root258]PSS62038.1 hypothetical protein C6558_24975 [Ensifer sp. NM-2]